MTLTEAREAIAAYDWEANGHGSADAALIWFLAYKNAEDARDSYDLKDWAELFRDGLRPMTISDVETWLKEAEEPETLLRDFFDC